MSSNEESSLKQYLLDQKVDPIDAKLNALWLDILKSKDRDRIADETRYNLMKVVHSGAWTGWSHPQLPEVKPTVGWSINTNLPPHALRIGNHTYKRFLFKEISNVNPSPERELTFAKFRPEGEGFNSGHFHKRGVSLKDQAALEEIRKRQLGEEIEKVEKLAKSRTRVYDRIPFGNALTESQIERLAHPLRTIRVPNQDPVIPFAPSAPSVVRGTHPIVPVATSDGRSGFTTAIQAVHHSRNLRKFNQVVGDAQLTPRKRAKTIVDSRANPNISDVALGVAQTVRADARQRVPSATPISQAQAI
ncbi:hypothetical protein HDV00_001225, partial [Rhizophlyctis rosea]